MWVYYRWLFELPDIIHYWGLPRGCWHCEVLGLCRRPKEEGWKCYNGCRVINEKKAKQQKLNLENRDGQCTNRKIDC